MIRINMFINSMANRTSTDENVTIRQFLEANDVDYASGSTISMDGANVRPGDLDETFASFGYGGDKATCNLAVIKKLDNARF